MKLVYDIIMEFVAFSAVAVLFRQPDRSGDLVAGSICQSAGG
jgi:hypothetical protein